MVIRIGKSDEENENKEKTGSQHKLSRSTWLAILVLLSVLLLIAFSVLNLPGRYKATVVSDGKEVLILDTVNGNVWCYRGNTDFAVITYQGKLKEGEKIPDRIVVKER